MKKYIIVKWSNCANKINIISHTYIAVQFAQLISLCLSYDRNQSLLFVSFDKSSQDFLIF